jgi:hypothetical protein
MEEDRDVAEAVQRGRGPSLWLSRNAAVVLSEAAVGSGEAAVVSGNAAVACQLIRVTASLATGVSDIAAVHSHEVRVALGFARVA